MKREISLVEISDGKLYDANDLVKTDCNGCKGCSTCCQGMGKSIILDPYDIYQLTINLNNSIEQLLADRIELNVVDGIILPNLKMKGATEQCSFLNDEGRCSIHSFRPGFCRLFPLGRYYDNNSFQYFIQVHECPYPNKTKTKVRKWIDTPDLKKYEMYISDWHYFLLDIENVISRSTDEKVAKDINMYLLKMFFLKPYRKDEFYEQFYNRLEDTKQIFN